MNDGKPSKMTPEKSLKLFQIDFVFDNKSGRGRKDGKCFDMTF